MSRTQQKLVLKPCPSIQPRSSERRSPFPRHVSKPLNTRFMYKGAKQNIEKKIPTFFAGTCIWSGIWAALNHLVYTVHRPAKRATSIDVGIFQLEIVSCLRRKNITEYWYYCTTLPLHCPEWHPIHSIWLGSRTGLDSQIMQRTALYCTVLTFAAHIQYDFVLSGT